MHVGLYGCMDVSGVWCLMSDASVWSRMLGQGCNVRQVGRARQGRAPQGTQVGSARQDRAIGKRRRREIMCCIFNSPTSIMFKLVLRPY